MTEDAEYRPLVPFDDESASFVNGFEAGIIWSEMQRGDAIAQDTPVHEANLVLLQRMADASGYDMEAGEIRDGWVFVKFAPRPAGAARHLRLVENTSQ